MTRDKEDPIVNPSRQPNNPSVYAPSNSTSTYMNQKKKKKKERKEEKEQQREIDKSTMTVRDFNTLLQ